MKGKMVIGWKMAAHWTRST